MRNHFNFPAAIQRKALERQNYKCASCGSRIGDIGERAQTDHKFGERAEAHHVVPHKMGGPLTVDNCVVVCRSCHLNAHQGGRWADVSIYSNLDKLSTEGKIKKIASLYPHYS